jgi:hypothetical protein
VRPALANIITARVPEADLLIDTMTVRPQGNRAFLISDTIRRLKAADIWAKLDVLWMLAAHDAQAARLNWKAPASFALTAVNSPTFTADCGYTGNGTTSYLTTGWNFSSSSVQYRQNDASIFGWIRTAGAGPGWGRSDGSFSNNAYFSSGANGVAVRVQTGNANLVATDASFAGLWTGVRTASNAQELFKNGSSITSNASASEALPNVTLFILRIVGDYGSHQMSVQGAGASLSTSQVRSFYSILQSYMSAIGAA